MNPGVEEIIGLTRNANEKKIEGYRHCTNHKDKKEQTAKWRSFVKVQRKIHDNLKGKLQLGSGSG